MPQCTSSGPRARRWPLSLTGNEKGNIMLSKHLALATMRFLTRHAEMWRRTSQQAYQWLEIYFFSKFWPARKWTLLSTGCSPHTATKPHQILCTSAFIRSAGKGFKHKMFMGHSVCK